MANLIDRDAFRKLHSEMCPGDCSSCDYCSATDGKLFCGLIDEAHAIDAVSPGTLEQYIWERDCAISQLKEIGKGFGERMDDVVRIVRCGECIHRRKPLYPHPSLVWCPLIEHHRSPDWFCAYGKKEGKDGTE